MAPRKPSCKGCCVLQKDCESCARCLPRYLCVDVIVTPGPYTDIHCCDPDGYGHGYFSFRMTQSCGAWSGSGTCTGLNTGLAIGVALNSACNTIVTTNLDATSFAFTGTLPAMSGISTNSDGDKFAWTISHCNVVENPRISDKCSPCTCTTCLPRKLCVTYSGQHEAGAFSMEWDCRSGWGAAGLPSGVSATASLKPASSGVCGIDIAISTDFGSYEGTILLEGPLHSRKIHGTICKDSGLLLSTLGVPELKPCPPGETCDDPPPQGWSSFIDATVNLTGPYGVAGSATIRDQSCGDCVFKTCSTVNCACAELGVDPALISGGATGTDQGGNAYGFTFVSTIPWSLQYHGQVGPQPVTMIITCQADGTPTVGPLMKLVVTYEPGGPCSFPHTPTAVEAFTNALSCSPFDAVFSIDVCGTPVVITVTE